MNSEKETNRNLNYSRRRFISKYLIGFSGIATAGSALTACKETSEKQVTTNNPCEDFSNVSDADKIKREKLGYKKQSPIPDMTCDKCNLYLSSANNKDCGGCMLFKGPVYPSSYCTYWVAKQEQP